MKILHHTVIDKNGIHARPAGSLVNTAKKYGSDIRISYGTKSADMKKIFAVMNLGIGFGDDFTVMINGVDEDSAANAIETALNETGI